MDNYSSLKGTRVLVVEDDALQAEIAEGTLAELGCVVTGSAASVEAALVAIDKVDTFDCVVGRSSRARNSGDVAGKLIARDIPFVVCSGYDLTLQGLNIPVVRKPYTTDALAQALGTAMSSVRKPGSSAPIR